MVHCVLCVSWWMGWLTEVQQFRSSTAVSYAAWTFYATFVSTADASDEEGLEADLSFIGSHAFARMEGDVDKQRRLILQGQLSEAALQKQHQRKWEFPCLCECFGLASCSEDQPSCSFHYLLSLVSPSVSVAASLFWMEWVAKEKPFNPLACPVHWNSWLGLLPHDVTALSPLYVVGSLALVLPACFRGSGQLAEVYLFVSK